METNSTIKTEKQKMLSGELYDAGDAELSAERAKAHLLFQALNSTREDQEEERLRLLRELIPHAGTRVWIEPPFYCDYGYNITLGDHVFFNFNCTILDICPVTIGSHVLIGPGVQILTATHPINAAIRRSGLEGGKPITIGDDVWIGGGAIICPGVTIGARSVIGAGSVVTRDIPADVVAVGNPCRALRQIAE